MKENLDKNTGLYINIKVIDLVKFWNLKTFLNFSIVYKCIDDVHKLLF